MKEYLIIKLGALGDIIMSLSMISQIRALEKESKIYWIGNRAHQDLFSILDIENLIYLPIDGELAVANSFIQKIKIAFQISFNTFRAHWEHVYLCHLDPRYLKLLFWVNKRKISSLYGPKRRNMIPGRYHGEEYTRLVKGSDDNAFIPFQLPALKTTVIKQPKQVVLSPGGNPKMQPGKNLRQWPLSYYVTLAKELLAKGYNVIVIGTKEDANVLSAFSELSVTFLVGKQSISECIKTIASSLCLITCDSGPMHMAILAKTQVFALFGPTLAEEKLPLHHEQFRTQVTVLKNTSGLTCAPCYDGKFYANCKDNKCMKQITPEMVLNKVMEYENSTFA